MRVLWTSPHCRPDWLGRLGEESQGGQAVVMNRLPHALARADPAIRVDVFTRFQADDPHAESPVKFLDDDPQVRVIRLPCGPTDRYLPKEFLYGEPIAEFADHIRAFAARERLRYDLLHGHYPDGWETVTLLAARWPHRPPVLLTTHSLGRRKRADGLARGEGTPEELDKRYNFPVRIASEERSLAAADRILPLSTPEAEFLVAHYQAVLPDDPRVTIVPNGIDPEDFLPPSPEVRPRLRRKLGIGEKTFLLLVPSRVDPRKGQENLLRALDKGRERLEGRAFQVLFLAWPAPPTSYAARLERMVAEAGLGRWVATHSSVPHERMRAFFAAADGVALPSQEYFSIAMLEAMLLERPLIASIHSSGRDVIVNGVHGLLVDHNDPAALAEAVVRLLQMGPAARREMGRRARARVLEGYTWERVAERLRTIYRDAVTRRPGR
ncbi:MAG TPA: glycosyltransferase [Chloroflexi bacterium]|nr:glycosyltransferase [Chloroflexota bacterium]